MDRDALRRQLSAHTPADSQERGCVARFRDLLDLEVDCFSKRCFTPGHVTTSAVVVSPDLTRILLVSHRDFGFWMQPGGHVDPTDADGVSAARRELLEETGLDRILVPAWAPDVLDVDVHDVPAGLKRGEPAHNHFDLRFAFLALTLDVHAATDAKDAAWFPLDGLEDLNTDDSVRRAAARVLGRLGG